MLIDAVSVYSHLNYYSKTLVGVNLNNLMYKGESKIMSIEDKPIIGITGSAGKTMVKSMVSAILREKWHIFESGDYQNTTVNTPEHKKKIQPSHKAAVLEYGMGFPGQIAEHCSIIQPNMAIITHIGAAHIEHFGEKIENLAAEKSSIFKGMNESGMLFINSDDEYSKKLHTSSFKGTIVRISIEAPSYYRAKDVTYGQEGMEFSMSLHGKKHYFTVPVYGLHNVYNALFAIAIADHLGFNPEDMQQGLKRMNKPKHRLEFHYLKNDITIIDDTVHAHPTAMKAAIDVLIEAGNGKKIAVLGSMGGLGHEDLMEAEHIKIGKYVVDKGIETLFTYGNFSRYIASGAREAGIPEEQVKHFTPIYRKNLSREVLKTIEPGSTILIKGSSRQEMYKTVQFLQKELTK